MQPIWKQRYPTGAYYFAFLIDIIDNIITYSPYYVTITSDNISAVYWSRDFRLYHVTSILHSHWRRFIWRNTDFYIILLIISTKNAELISFFLCSPFKGTIGVISSDSPCKDGNARFSRVHLKPLSDQVWIRYAWICYFNLWFLWKSDLRIFLC